MLRRNQRVRNINMAAGPVTGTVVKVNANGTVDVLVKGLSVPWKNQPVKNWEAV